MFKDYDDLIKQMELEMQRASAEAMRCLLELPENTQEFWRPRTDVYETEDQLVVRMEVAGVCRDTLGVSLSSDRRILTIRGSREEKCVDDRRKLRYHQLEAYFGTFEREVPLPREVQIDSENIKATYRDGFVLVNLQKAEKEQITRTIPVSEE